MIDLLFRVIVQLLLRLRYRISVRGLEEIRSRGMERIVFLPNHPALIDPVIIVSILYKDFRPHSLADAFRIRHPLVGWIARRFGARPLPAVATGGSTVLSAVNREIDAATRDLSEGANLLIYPGGRLKRGYLEEIGSRSAVQRIVEACPDVRIVLIRQNGLWGSSFSWASGKSPDLLPNLKHKARYLFLNGFFFMPRRPVEIELKEAFDFPRHGSRAAMNQYMEEYYNTGAWRRTYVPYLFWERGGVKSLAEPEYAESSLDPETVPETTRKLVMEKLEEITGQTSLVAGQRLSQDLGLDSLAVAEIVVWIQQEFGFSHVDTDSLITVGDVMLASVGKGTSSDSGMMKPISKNWFADAADDGVLNVPAGDTIADVFLRQARLDPGKVIIADQTSGEKRYRDIVAGIMALKPEIESLPGKNIGIMLPASVGGVIVYLAILFAGKTPVMVNWTVEPRNIGHCLKLASVECVLTAKALVSRLEAQGTDLSRIRDRFIFLESVGKRIGILQKASAFFRSRVSWSSLAHADNDKTAVVLFTSGSESLPKAVPLTHNNILSNIRDIPSVATLRKNDVLIGMLPMFHSFGITVTAVLPLCLGLKTVFHTNPTQAPLLARIIEQYRVSLLVGTPTFLHGIARASRLEQLRSLRLVITGAEKCPGAVYRAVRESSPQVKILEGYGVTECSPIISCNRESEPHAYTIGKPLPSFEYAIVNHDTGAPVETGQMGMLLVRGPSLFEGYLNYDGISPFVKYQGNDWYRTGDLVSEDAQGVLTFLGRLKRFVKIGGEMISLPAVEEILKNHFDQDPDEGPVLAVQSTPDEEHPELVVFATRETDRDTLNRHIREAGLSALHNIRKVVKVEQIPVLGTGKTDYRELTRMLSVDDMTRIRR